MADQIVGADTDQLMRSAGVYDGTIETLNKTAGLAQSIADLTSQAIGNDPSGQQFAAQFNPTANQLMLSIVTSQAGVAAIQEAFKELASNFQQVEDDARDSIAAPDLFGAGDTPSSAPHEPEPKAPEPSAAKPRPVIPDP